MFKFLRINFHVKFHTPDYTAVFNFTYIFISHDLSVVKFMSDRMVVMNDGKIEEMGDADAIYNNPQTEYTQKLINAIPKGELDDIKKSMAKKQMKRTLVV